MHTLDTRLIDLTVADLIDIARTVLQERQLPAKDYTEKKYVYGLAGLASLLGCSKRRAWEIKSSGKIEAAVTQQGRTIIIDAEKALELLRQKK